ncbi:MAG: TIGR00159 family protein [Clostridia bacterium]|nr:TIGR00159 family protein [Clostridia bacterium]
MFENINISWTGIWQAFTGYMVDLSQNPFRLITLILDLVIVGYLIYKFVLYAKKTRAWQLLKGIVWIIAIVVLSEVLQLRILNFFLTFFMPYGVIALIVIFQPELRRMLEQIGTNRITKYFGFDKDLATKTKEDIYKIVIAATELAKSKTGGLIVLERDIQINDIADTGVRIGSEVSPQLIVNLFTPNTPLHDGAVIIANNKIAAAACILPLADDKDIAKELGTRHRAGLGISKESDAIAVIISEETGKISVAKEGTLIVDVKEDSLKNILIKHIVTKRFGDEKLKRVEKVKARKQQNIEQNKLEKRKEAEKREEK